MDTHPPKPRVLIFSLRNIFGKALFSCPHYKFEDIICEIDSPVLLAPELDPCSTRLRFTTRLTTHAPLALKPSINLTLDHNHYDVFFSMICSFPQDLLTVKRFAI